MKYLFEEIVIKSKINVRQTVDILQKEEGRNSKIGATTESNNNNNNAN